jgi:two-component system, chemotaxis family, protein-glutamate methylesterase/glutaminase
VTLKSLIKQPGDSLVGVVMTGLGADGAEGIAHVKAIGGRTLAQNRQTCVIYGMPAEAIRTGCVDSVLSPPAIRARLVQWMGTQKTAV